jgi:putative SOS response-associated peptidase YedK
VCNLYSMTKNVDAIRRLFSALNSRVGNLPSMPGIFPDYPAPIVRNAPEGREIVTARWGMPSSQQALLDATKKRAERLEAKGKPVDFKELLRMEPDGGTTNIRNVGSAHWKRWLATEHRCLVPFTSFSEYDTIDGKKVPVWFGPDESRPLLAFAGLWTNWTSVRKAKGRRSHDRCLRLPDLQAERRGGTRPSEGDAGEPDGNRRLRCLAARPLGRGQGAPAAVAGRSAEDRGDWREGRSCAGRLTFCTGGRNTWKSNSHAIRNP